MCLKFAVITSSIFKPFIPVSLFNRRKLVPRSAGTFVLVELTKLFLTYPPFFIPKFLMAGNLGADGLPNDGPPNNTL